AHLEARRRRLLPAVAAISRSARSRIGRTLQIGVQLFRRGQLHHRDDHTAIVVAHRGRELASRADLRGVANRGELTAPTHFIKQRITTTAFVSIMPAPLAQSPTQSMRSWRVRSSKLTQR